MAIVTQETVALFVDGRYVVQAANQCAGPVFSHHHLFDEPPEIWLASVAQEDWSIGFDAMHLPPAWYDRFADELAESTAQLAPVEGNPVDAIWPDQPAPPMGLIEPFPLQFAGKSSNDKIADLVAEMQTRGAAMMIETQPDNIAWLLNIRGSDVAFNPLAHSFALAECSGRVHWFVADQKLTTDVRDHLPPEVQVHSLNAFLPALTERVQPGQGVMFDPDFSPSATRLVLKKADANELPVKSPITLAKAQKNPTELEGLRNCHIRDGVALTEFCAWLAAEVPARATHNRRVSEHEAEEKVLFYRRAQPGFISESFRTISAAGGNAAMCHYAVNPETSGQSPPTEPICWIQAGNMRPAQRMRHAAFRSALTGPRAMISPIRQCSRPSTRWPRSASHLERRAIISTRSAAVRFGIWDWITTTAPGMGSAIACPYMNTPNALANPTTRLIWFPE